MRYHSNIQTVLTALLITFLFFLASLFLLFFLDLTSPTMIVTESLLSSLRKSSLDISLSFDRMERNFRDRVMIRDLKVYYSGEKAASFDRVEVKLGLFDVISYLLNLEGSAEVTLSEGTVNLDAFVLSADRSTSSSPSSSADAANPFSSFLSSHNLTLSFSDVLLLSGALECTLDEGEVSYIGEEGKIAGNIRASKLLYRKDGMKAGVNDALLAFSWGDTFFLKADAGEASLSSESFSLLLSSSVITMNADDPASLSSLSVNAVLDNEKGTLSLMGSDIVLSGTHAVYSKGNLDFSISSVTSDLFGSDFRVGRTEGGMKRNDIYTVKLGDISLDGGRTEMMGSSLIITGSLKNKELSFSADEAVTDVEEFTKNRIGDIYLSSIRGGLDYSEELDLSLSLSSVLTTPSEKIDDISFSLDSAVHIRNGKLEKSHVDIKDLYLGWGERMDSSFTLTGDLDREEVVFSYGPLLMSLFFSVNEKKLGGDIVVSKLEMKDFLPLLSSYGINIFSGKSVLDLKTDFSLSHDGNLSGAMDYSLAVSSLELGFVETDFSSTGKVGVRDNSLYLDEVNLSTSLFSVSTSGVWHKGALLPDMELSLLLPNGKTALSGHLSENENKGNYQYYCLFPLLEDTRLSGEVNFERKGSVTSEALLVTAGNRRPFSFLFRDDEKNLSLLSPSFSLMLSWRDGFLCSLSLENLETLHGEEESIVIDGGLEFSLRGDDGLVLSSSPITVSDIFVLPSSPDLSFSLSGRDGRYFLSGISFQGKDEAFTYTGNATLDFVENILALRLTDSSSGGKILLSLYKDEEFVGTFRGTDIDLTPLGMENMFCSFNLFGRALELEDFSFDGVVNVVSPATESEKINAEITVDATSLVFGNIAYFSPTLEASLDRLYFYAETGLFGIDGCSFFLPNEKADGAKSVTGRFSIAGKTDPSDSLVTAVSEIFRRKGDGLTLDFSLSSLDMDNGAIHVENGFSECMIGRDEVVFSGSLLSGTYDRRKKALDMALSLEGVVDAHFNADFSDGLKVNADVARFNMSAVNLMMEYPLVVFRDDLVSGEVSLVGRDGIYSLNGALWGNELGVDVFWLEDQTLVLHNPRFIIWDNELRSNVTYTTVIDHLTSERKAITLEVGVTMNETLSLEGWDCDMFVDEDNSVRVRIPLHPISIDILSYVNGHYYVSSDENGMMNSGTLNLFNTTLTIGMNPFPEWYRKITGAALLDMRINFMKNNRILYPAGDDPIFEIVLEDNSSVYSLVSQDSLSFSGDVSIRGGEIFYFQKYFYITSGSISFDSPGEFMPRINLRATLRDYDSESEKVEIYLVMKDNTFDNLSPTLESSPAKEMSEIMEILGQSILPSDTYANMSVSSVASLVTEGFDILSRLGIVTSGTNPLSSLSASLKTVFGVDSFSLHSNILNNIVADTISQATENRVSTYSPMARFLKGTTLNIGKYLSQNLYMQIMIHLEEATKQSSYTIIADDLALDTEFSLEWSNPAFSVTFFTRPSYFSFYSLLSTFGFSVTKTFNF